MTSQDFLTHLTQLNITLSPQQLTAVQAVEGPVLLLAVPGSGKTTVLVTRLGYMVKCCSVYPEEILTLTYTVAATKDMAERKQKMIELADAYVALPGGPGTLDEITDVISLARLGIEDKPCVLLDIDGFYQPLKTVFDQMLEVGFAEKGDFRKVLISEDLGKIGVFLEK